MKRLHGLFQAFVLLIFTMMLALFPCEALAEDAAVVAAGGIDFVTLLLQTMNPLAVILAVAFTQGIKYLFPGPVPGERSTETVSGTVYNRILPFVPVVIGLIVVLFERWGQPIAQSLVQGIVSGIAAAYFYRTWKVTIFGA